MTRPFKLFFLSLIILHPFVFLLGQQTGKTICDQRLKIVDINRICKSIDQNKNLGESIKEGETLDRKGGFDTYFLQEKTNNTLHRIKHSSSTDRYYMSTFYYKHNKVIKAIIIITDYQMPKKKYAATYYFDNNKLIKRVGENIIYSNYKEVLKQGLDFQEQFYSDKRRLKNGVQQTAL